MFNGRNQKFKHFSMHIETNLSIVSSSSHVYSKSSSIQLVSVP